MIDLMTMLAITAVLAAPPTTGRSPKYPPAYLPYSGRHVCSHHKVVQRPVTKTISYCQPVYKPYMTFCDGYQLCSRYKTIYQTAYRIQYYMTVVTEQVNACCPGWTHSNNLSRGCRIPICKQTCQNLGRCTAPDTCRCQHGYTGKYCDQDLDECETNNHECQHTCVNTMGSYTCECHTGFALDKDGKSCEVCLTCTPEYQSLLIRISQIEENFMNKLKQAESVFQTTVQQLESEVKHLSQEVISCNNNNYNHNSSNVNHPILNDMNEEQLQQLERISSLSDQILILEERLGMCNCAGEGETPLR